MQATIEINHLDNHRCARRRGSVRPSPSISLCCGGGGQYCSRQKTEGRNAGDADTIPMKIGAERE
jgi:hypothetical protein